MLPVDAILKAQEVPHCLSFHRRVFEQVGLYPEDTSTGEDTLFNLRCVEAGLAVAFSGQIQMAHLGNTSIVGMLRHGYEHGRGLMQCSQRHGLGSAIGNPNTVWRCAWRALVIYPAAGLWAKFRRFSRFAPGFLWPLVTASPPMYLAQLATGLGAAMEWRRGRLQAITPSPP